MRDDLFHRHGLTWHRAWVGDNSGHYEWTTADGLCVVWREGPDYRAAVDGITAERRYHTILAAMEAAEHALRRAA